MDIIINRQSVCMGDDVEDHALTYTIGPDTKFSDVFQDLIGQGYFPNVSGNDVVWTLFCGKDDLISWKTKENKLYHRFVTGEPAILNVERWAAASIIFKYASPLMKRAQHIFQQFGGSKFHIWHEGFMFEYETYHIPQALEEEWRRTICGI